MRDVAPRHRETRTKAWSSAGRALNLSTAVLATAVLSDSAMEHYRGSFRNRAMYAPLGSAALTLAASLSGAADRRERGARSRDAIYAAAALTGLVGTAFHAYNIGKRPSGFSWLNLFYAAPIGAPFALVLTGILGRAAEEVRERARRPRADTSDLRLARRLAALGAVGLCGTSAEAALFHFRGAYHNPAMLLPVTLPPVAAGMLGLAAATNEPRHGRLARAFLKLTAALGLAGFGFHAFGVSRNMGGWRNWSQNLLSGPPLPAPPSFTGVALAGLAALKLMEEERRR